jgi:Flp pilus assembly protein TadD
MPNNIQDLLNQGKVDEAKILCERALAKDGENPRLLHVSAMISYVEKDFDSAYTQIQRAYESLKDDGSFQISIGLIEFARKKSKTAIKHIKEAIKIDSKNISAYINLGYVYLQLKDYQTAIDTYNEGIKHIDQETSISNQAALHYNLAITFKNAGLILQAIKEYEHTLDINPKHKSALLNLATIYIDRQDFNQAKNLLEKILSINPTHKKALYHLSNSPLTEAECNKYLQLCTNSMKSVANEEESIRLFYTQGNLQHKIQEYNKAWDAYYQANKIVAQSNPFNAAAFETECNNIKEYYQQHQLKDYATGTNSTQPVFIIGAPRSGKSLCEKLLRHHEDISGIGEGTYFVQQVEAWKKSANNNLTLAFAEFNSAKLKKIAQCYLDYAHNKAGDPTQYILDTMPYHGIFMGFLYQIFPKAKFIIVNRNKLDTICEIYFKWFEVGHEYSYKVESCSKFFDKYYEMLSFWQELLPKENIINISYEELVNNTTTTCNNITKFLKLDSSYNPNWLPPGMYLNKDELNVHEHYKKWLNVEV